MKKKVLIAMCAIGCSFLVACGGKETESQTQTDAPAVQSEENDADAPAETAASEKDFDGGSYSDTGDGTFLLVNASGNTENGNVIVVYVSADTALEQIGYETSGMNGGALSYIYIDGMLSAKEQLGDSQGSLDLSGDSLSAGTHTVEVVQYEDDLEENAVTVYKSASYEVKEK